MNLSNQVDVLATYLSLTPTNKGFNFSVDGKEPDYDFKKTIHAIVNYATMSHQPIIAKIEILDKDEYYILSLNIPVLPAFLDIKSTSDIDLLNNENYKQIAKQRAINMTAYQTVQAIDERTTQYLNYIQHEFAGAYITCKTSGQDDIASLIQKFSIMKQFNLADFKFSTGGRNIYKTPQILKCNYKLNNRIHTRNYYVGLQENIPEANKDADFWKKVSQRDKDYMILDESLNYTIEQLVKKYGEIEFLPPDASSNFNESVTPEKK